MVGARSVESRATRRHEIRKRRDIEQNRGKNVSPRVLPARTGEHGFLREVTFDRAEPAMFG
jgi:hypothetical protein